MVRSSLKSSAQQAYRLRGTASILAIGTANPENHYLQSEFPDFYFRVTNSSHMTELKNKFQRICENSGIRKRHSYLTEEILRSNPTHSISVMQELVTNEIPLLGVRAAEKAVEEWGRTVSDITHLIFVTTTVVGSPTADFRFAKLLGLRASVRRHFVYGQACSGGSSALRLAMDVVGNDSDARVLVVASENMAVSFSAPSPDNIVAPAMFGDGAAAVIVGGSTTVGGLERPLFDMVSAFDMSVPDSENAVSGTMTDSGLVYKLSPRIPLYLEANIESVIEKAFPGEDRNSVFYAVHPGGRAVLDKVESKLGLTPEKLRASRHILAEHGNMWGPSVIFVLDELRKKAAAEGKATTGDGLDWGVMVAIGPGITVENIVLRSANIP